jgi:hypothetical protein
LTNIVEADASAVDARAIAEEEAKAYGRVAKSDRTRVECARGWAHFAAWCAKRGLASLPASQPAVVPYLGTLGESEDRVHPAPGRRDLTTAQRTRLRVADDAQTRARGRDGDRAHQWLGNSDGRAPSRPKF